MEWDTLVIMASVVALLIWVEHWFPWAKLLKRDQGLPRLAAYTLGVAAIGGPWTIWALRQDGRDAVIAFWLAVVVAGVATVVAWVIDGLLAARDVLGILDETSDEG